VLGDEALHRIDTDIDHRHLLWQLLDPLQAGGPLGFSAQSLADRFLELGRQGGFEDHHRHFGRAQARCRPAVRRRCADRSSGRTSRTSWRIVARRSACVLLPGNEAEFGQAGEEWRAERSKLPPASTSAHNRESLPDRVPRDRKRSARSWMPSRCPSKGLRWCRFRQWRAGGRRRYGRTRRARRSRWSPAPADRSAAPSCARCGRRRCCRSCPKVRQRRPGSIAAPRAAAVAAK
jgi:hypothetical protein